MIRRIETEYMVYGLVELEMEVKHQPNFKTKDNPTDHVHYIWPPRLVKLNLDTSVKTYQLDQ